MDPVSPNSAAAASAGKNPILVYVLADTNDQAISDAILKHLKPIVRDFPLPIEIDSDFSAPPGADRERYQARLLEANIVLALISSDFIDNDALYARNQSVMDRHNRGQTVMIPVLIRNCMWKRTPFARLNVLPRNYQPLNNRQYWNSQDDAIMAVVEDIDRSLNELARQGAIEIAPAPAAAGPAPASAAARPRPAVSPRPMTAATPTPAPKPAAAATPSKPANLGEQLALAAATIGVSGSSAGSTQPETAAAAPQGDWRRSYYWGAFWKRGLALFLDYLLSGVVMVAALLAVGGASESSDDSASPGAIAIFLVFFYLACPYFESKWGATPGKMIVGLQITDKDGNRLSFRQAFVRNFFRSISFYLYCFIIPAIYQFSRFKQTRKLFHDEWSNTVIGERLRKARANPAAVPAE